jgi:integrase
MNLVKDKKDGFFRYDFTLYGKRHRGNTFLKKKDSATRFTYDLISDIRHNDYGDDITLDNAWHLFLKSPHAGNPCEKRLKAEKGKFNVLIQYMKDRHIKILSDVKEDDVLSYVKSLKINGKPTKKGFQKLSPHTLNEYLIVGSKVLRALLPENPFRNVKKAKKSQTDRQPFTQEEIDLMLEKATGEIKYILMIGLYTGLRKGDICTLQWDDIDMLRKVITRKQNKTGTIVKIPIADELFRYLHGWPVWNGCLNNTLANWYGRNPSFISYEFKAFLQKLGIVNSTKNEAGRSVSTKDIHSLRHTFAYIAARNNIPIGTVKSILGHADESVTKIYAEHASTQDMKEAVDTVQEQICPQIVGRLDRPVSIDEDILTLVKTMEANNWQTVKRIILRNFK